MSWFKEKFSYNLMEGSCSGVCGHYTQVEHHGYLHVEGLQVSHKPFQVVYLDHLYIFCRWFGRTRNIWVVLLPSARSSSEEEGVTIMFVTTDQGNLCKTLHDMSINEWTKSFNLYPHFIQVLFTKIILFFFFENF